MLERNKDTESANVLEAFIAKFGDSFYASLARERPELKKKEEEKLAVADVASAGRAFQAGRAGGRHNSEAWRNPQIQFSAIGMFTPAAQGRRKSALRVHRRTKASRKQREYTGIYIASWPESFDHAKHEVSIQRWAHR